MGEALMQLGPEQLEAIGTYVRSHLKEWISDESAAPVVRRERELDLIERTIRVEESLKNLQEQVKTGFEYMARRFEQVDKRFEQADKRFEELRDDMKTQFNRVYGFLTGLFLAVAGGFMTLVIQG